MGLTDKIKQQFGKGKEKAAPIVDKASEQFEKNKHKVAPIVEKATDQVDKVTKGKSANVTDKVDEAARKLSGSATTGGTEPMPTQDEGTAEDESAPKP